MDPRWAKVKALIDEQANDEGLWFVAQYATESMLQCALRELHMAIEEVFNTEDPVHGTWWTKSDHDPRWNGNGESLNVSGVRICDECLKSLEQKRHQFGQPPKDLRFGSERSKR